MQGLQKRQKYQFLLFFLKKVGKKFGSFKKKSHLCIVIKNYKLFYLFTHGQEHNKTTKNMKNMKEIKHSGMKKTQDKDGSEKGTEYIVSRTSAWMDTKPCEEAYRKEGEKYDWYVRINSLEDLMNFIKKYGKVVVNEGSIEIYDDWREQ